MLKKQGGQAQLNIKQLYMKRILLSFAIIISSFTSVSAQKELYFSDKDRDSISISDLQGFSFDFADGHGITAGGLTVSYFNEHKLSSTTSLILSGGITNSMYIKSIINPVGDPYYSTRPQINYGYGLQINLLTEPRWYFTYKNRYLKGSKTALNTGWFIGLPFEMNSSVLNSTQPLCLNLFLVPTLGYRYALSNKLFLEAQAGYGLSFKYFHSFQSLPYIKIKAGYTFK